MLLTLPTMAQERVMTWTVIFKDRLISTNGGYLTETEIIKSIHDHHFRGIGQWTNLKFEFVINPSHADFITYVEKHYPDPCCAGKYYHDRYKVLDALDHRGWNYHKVGVIDLHETCHSGRFFGLGHTYRTYTENGKTHNYLMHPWVSGLGQFYTSPEERQRLVNRYGPDPDNERLYTLWGDIEPLVLSRKKLLDQRTDAQNKVRTARTNLDKALDDRDYYFERKAVAIRIIQRTKDPALKRNAEDWLDWIKSQVQRLNKLINTLNKRIDYFSDRAQQITTKTKPLTNKIKSISIQIKKIQNDIENFRD